ncbi:MAG TPA: electron transfer flavoprotein subunit beta/FixA family protein, partial [Candidatus Limnocylindria bacterium]|nr:electron transfer flavoprotein subunit beta/FixA family protein [Candidatus Limnocylindria bacterium]
TVVSMGPPAAEKALREALAMGCDDAALLTDRAFAGADTWATANVLAAAIRRMGAYDLIVCGERATDGDTAQVGPELAAALDAPLATYVSHIESVSPDAGEITVRRMTDFGSERLALPLPALLTVVKEAAFPRLPTLRGKQRARSAPLTVWGAQDLGLEAQDTGLKGSPTRVVKIESPRVTRGGTVLRVTDERSLDDAVEQLAAFLRERGIV